MIYLYHGSNVVVRQPKLMPQARALDFGRASDALACLSFKEERAV